MTDFLNFFTINSRNWDYRTFCAVFPYESLLKNKENTQSVYAFKQALDFEDIIPQTTLVDLSDLKTDLSAKDLKSIFGLLHIICQK